MSTPLGERMKGYEEVTRTVLPRRTYTILRCDGRAFHTYLRGAQRPYDYGFMADMDAVAAALCDEISGAVFAFVQSDEVSVLAVDFGGPTTQPWFGGEVQKMVSVAAATATAALVRRRPAGAPTFDARVFTVDDPVEVANYFVWRQQDCVRNSITMAALAQFPHRRLHGVSGAQKVALLRAEKGIDWEAYPDTAKRGRVVVRRTGERLVTFTHRKTGREETVTALRSWWEAEAAPPFTADGRGLLAELIPAGTSPRPPGP
ncbi:hypothetical protein Val02_12140 [Virgisporangium aliadipatigenens]|uniref:tRNAHis guanylyltransferase catalytic domain-containing protein n=1 Tax=Virgisporangium aliadipatigenens TaxID=741659 RepID=A0A8J3YHJ1_9ACTN|nr:tRNA(His) guanylyltransferase Thg1 family protein [Virgisporangium aliadipatigenens]GIJ44328.1 hypothetical protein Val02_12140 [Virgisporangium aliadipatigenens]